MFNRLQAVKRLQRYNFFCKYANFMTIFNVNKRIMPVRLTVTDNVCGDFQTVPDEL